MQQSGTGNIQKLVNISSNLILSFRILMVGTVAQPTLKSHTALNVFATMIALITKNFALIVSVIVMIVHIM